MYPSFVRSECVLSLVFPLFHLDSGAKMVGKWDVIYRCCGGKVNKMHEEKMTHSLKHTETASNVIDGRACGNENSLN